MPNSMKVILVEDETIIAEYLKSVLEKMGNHVRVLLSGNLDFDSYLNQHQPDLVFLDINLESKATGIDLARACKNKGVPFVYLTSYSDPKTIGEALQYEPLSYMLKPFTEEEVFKTIEVARIKISQNNGAQFLNLKEGYDTVRIKMSDIRWLKSDNVYTEISTNSKKIIHRKPLSEMMDLLPATSFIRVHRSYIVNMNRIERVGADYLEVDNERIPISRSKKASILDMITTD